VDALCIQNRGVFGHFEDGYLFRQLVGQVNNRENVPMLTVF
jgi:hypothetical protein